MEVEPTKAEPPKRKRRWLQFSLRTLFILVLIVATPCAWLGHKIAQKRREREFVEEIRNWGGIVTYDYQIARSKPSGPAWLRSLLGENFFNDVKVVYAGSSPISDADVARFEDFPRLQVLHLNDTKMSDAGIDTIKHLTALEFLDLDGTKVTDAGINGLRRALPKCMVISTEDARTIFAD
jgi:hypothetical protein